MKCLLVGRFDCVFNGIFGLRDTIGFLRPLRKIRRLATLGAKRAEPALVVPWDGFATLRAVNNTLKALNTLFHKQTINRDKIGIEGFYHFDGCLRIAR